MVLLDRDTRWCRWAGAQGGVVGQGHKVVSLGRDTNQHINLAINNFEKEIPMQD